MAAASTRFEDLSAGVQLTGEELGSHLARLRPRMTSVALRFAPNREAAEDIVQNAYEKAVRNLGQFRGNALLSTWLHRIVVNESLMWIRSEKRRTRRLLEVEEWNDADWVEPTPGPSERLALRQRSRQLQSGLAQLPVEEREVLVECGLGDQSYEQFCALRGLLPAAAKSRAFRGRRRLRGLLGDDSSFLLGDF